MDIVKHNLERAGQKFPAWKEGEFQTHFIHTGVGEGIFLIFPDGTTMLLDCGDQAAVTRRELAVPIVPGPERLAGEWIARYIARVAPKSLSTRNGLPLLDYMMLTHYHNDHAGSTKWQSIYPDGKGLPNCCRSGFELVAEHFAFDTALDRAFPDFQDRCDNVAADLDALEHIQRLYQALQERDGLRLETFRLGNNGQVAMRHRPADYPDFSVTNITGNGRILCQDGGIRDLYAERVKMPEKVNENGMSLGNEPIIKFDHVSFSFNEDSYFLNDLDFEIRKGETFAIIGGTGSGKSTVINLIERFYDVSKGNILYKGIPLKEYDLSSLRKDIGLVNQKSSLFKGTIKSNYLMSNPDASDEDIIKALTNSQAYEFVSKYSDTINHEVNEGGLNFSGGQRQRLCIGRALVKNPEVLILDDATSALDLLTDKKIRDYVSSIKDMTKIIVSQRVATVQHADYILVLEGGKVVGQGKHEDLLNNCPIYQEIYQTQIRKE